MTGRRGTRLSRGVTVVACLGMALAGACARQGAPPGGPEDRRPPVVIRTEPDTFARLEGFDGPVRFHFDERISERVDGVLDDAVVVSPATGDVRVSHNRTTLTVDVAGGFRPGVPAPPELLKGSAYRNRVRLRAPDDVSLAVGQPIRAEQRIVGQDAKRFRRYVREARRQFRHPERGDSDRRAKLWHVLHLPEQLNEQLALRGVEPRAQESLENAGLGALPKKPGEPHRVAGARPRVCQ